MSPDGSTARGRVVGVGFDLADAGRLAASLARRSGLAERLFTPAERDLPAASLAARFAAKEAIAKALGGPAELGWHDVEVVTEPSGAPAFRLSGSVLAAAEARGVRHSHLTLSHDGGVAIAFVILES